MPEEDKKIKFKFIKAEDLLKEEEGEIKEAEVPKEEVRITEITKIEEEKEEIKKETTPPQAEPKIEYRIEIEQPTPPPPLYPEPKKEVKKKEIKLPPIPFYALILFLFLGGAIFIFLFLKKPKTPEIVKKEEVPKTTETVTLFIPTTTPSTPTETTTSTSTETITFTVPTIPTETPTTFFPTTLPEEISGEISIFKTYPSKEINLKNLDEFNQVLKNLFSKQEKAGEIYLIKFIYNQRLMPVDPIFNYFIKNEEIKPLIKNYSFLLYYTYTRKSPILVFEVNDSQKAKSINQYWEKKMPEDLKTLFLEFDPGKPLTKNFQTKSFQNFSYRILKFPYSYNIIWGLKDNYLIYSSNETALQKIISLLR